MQVEKSLEMQKKPIIERDGNDKFAILKEAKERLAKSYSYFKDNYKQAEEDVSFLYDNNDDGAMIDENDRLKLRFNRLPQFVNRVVGAQRNEVQTINVVPTGTSIGQEEPKLTTMSGKEIKLSQVLSDLIRDIEYNSNAVAAYKQAFKHALEGGFGWIRVLTEYEKNGFNLNIRIKGVRDRWSVLVDPEAQEPDLSDMNYAFISERMSRKEFKKRYPGKSAEPLSGEEYETYWGDEETVTVTEYFRREPYTKTICLLSDGRIVDKKDIKGKEDILLANGLKIVKERKIQDWRVIWCKITNNEILEGETEFPSSTIPIVPVFGRITDFKNKRRFKGLVFDAKDAQIALNKTLSSALERIDTSPLSPFIASDKAIEGYEDMWAEANTFKYSTLVYRKGEEPPRRESGATVPVAEINLVPVIDDSIKSSTGIFNASLGQQSNETSGVAIRARQAEGDVGTYEFIDNYRMAIRRVGLIVVEMLPRVYDTNRTVMLRKLDNTTDIIELNKVVRDPITGETVVLNTLNLGEHTVEITSGATYNTKREENAEQILKLMQVSPAVAQVGSDLLVRNLDFSESDVLADRLEKTIPLQYLSKEKREEIQKEMPDQQPSPEEIKMQAEVQKEQIRLEIEKMRLAIEQTKLETAKLQEQLKLASAEDDRRNKVANLVADMVAKAGENGNS